MCSGSSGVTIAARHRTARGVRDLHAPRVGMISTQVLRKTAITVATAHAPHRRLLNSTPHPCRHLA